MPILDPSTFHGYTDCLQQYLDGVKSLGAEKVGTEDCDKIELSIMKHQRSWFLWLSKLFGMPLIPVFNSANKSGILVDVADDENATAHTVTSLLVELAPGTLATPARA